jgi:hypothetical protein
MNEKPELDADDYYRYTSADASYDCGAPHTYLGGSEVSYDYLRLSFAGYCGAAPTDIPENRPRPDRPGVGASAGGFGASVG